MPPARKLRHGAGPRPTAWRHRRGSSRTPGWRRNCVPLDDEGGATGGLPCLIDGVARPATWPCCAERGERATLTSNAPCVARLQRLLRASRAPPFRR